MTGRIMGGVIAKETRAGRATHFVICSRGEAGSYGTPKQRMAEAKKSAAILGATIEFIELDGDAHLEIHVSHTIKLAGIIRRCDPVLCLRRVSLKINIPITRSWEELFVMLHALRAMAV
ncbi:MAG: PIG-L family deacetylase [Limisphaerales bacterium]